MQNNPEDSFMSSHEASEVSSDFVDLVYDEISEKIDTYRIKESTFDNIYSEEKIKNDLAKVKERENWFKQNNSPEQKIAKKSANILEYMIFELLEAEDWMSDFRDKAGNSINPEIAAETMLASKYDDLFNGADIIFKPGGVAGSSRVSVFSIDTTFIHDKDSLEKKNWDRYNLEHQQGLANVEYYKSSGFTGRVENVPRFIIGVDMSQMFELAKYRYLHPKKSDMDEEEKREAADLSMELRCKVVTQLATEAMIMSELAQEKYNKLSHHEITARKQFSNIYDNLAAARNYFGQAYEKMIAELARSGRHNRSYSVRRKDPVHDGIINYYLGVKGQESSSNLGAKVLDFFFKSDN
jgi:hypothetical protein